MTFGSSFLRNLTASSIVLIVALALFALSLVLRTEGVLVAHVLGLKDETGHIVLQIARVMAVFGGILLLIYYGLRYTEMKRRARDEKI